MNEKTFELTSGEVAMERFRERIERLLPTATNQIVTRHLESTLMVVESVYRMLPLTGAARAEETGYFIDKVAQISARLPVERFDWEAHVRKALPFVQAFISERDYSLQFYALQLPYGWKPGMAYPLTVYLHGMVGNVNPLEGLSTAFDNTHQDTLFAFDDIDPANVPAVHRGFILAPWGRGNEGYQGISEADVMQSISDVKERFSIDEERQYMSGFSMGCSGAWGIAARTPDMWAGINTASGFGQWSETRHAWLADNARGIPVMVWIGELDGMLDGAREFNRLLVSRDFAQKFEVAKDVPHTYPYAWYKANMAWLMQFTRPRRTDEFTFETDTAAHAGRNGIMMGMTWRQTPSPRPHFACSIASQTVTITSENTTGLAVALGKDGLGMEGEVTVTWNGKEVYAGPAATIELGAGAPSDRRRRRR